MRLTTQKCPVTGRPMVSNLLNGYLQPETLYSSDENPEGLNQRIEDAGYNPSAYMGFDGAIPVLAYIIVDGERIARVEPCRDRGRFGGWQVIPESPGKVGIIHSFTMPEFYEIEWQV